MGTLCEKLSATKRKKVILELVKGKETATKLRTLIGNNQILHHDQVGFVSAEEMAFEILRSFTHSLSVLTSPNEDRTSSRPPSSPPLPPPIAASANISGEDKKKNKPRGSKDRRGCYKRRRTSDSWSTVSHVMEDGRAWRKYGQKGILNSEYPRCYFRCTYKQQGCKATKQVQRIQTDPILYQTTYFGHHTCKDTTKPLQTYACHESDMLSFQASATVEEEHTLYTVQTHSDDNISDTKSSPGSSNLWEFMASESSTCVASDNSKVFSGYTSYLISSSVKMEGISDEQVDDLDYFDELEPLDLMT